MAMLLPLGIEKGTPFDPDERQQTILLKGAAMGELMARNLQVNPRFVQPYWKDTTGTRASTSQWSRKPPLASSRRTHHLVL